jgi:hypothetical protein
MLGKQRKGEHQRKPLFKDEYRVSGFVLTGVLTADKKLECIGKLSHYGYLSEVLEDFGNETQRLQLLRSAKGLSDSCHPRTTARYI